MVKLPIFVEISKILVIILRNRVKKGGICTGV